MPSNKKETNLANLVGQTVQIKKSWQGIRCSVEEFPLQYDLQSVVNEALVSSKTRLEKGVPPLSDDMFGYYIGLWLRAGTTRCVYQCENLYPETAHFLLSFAQSCGLNLVRYFPPSKSTKGWLVTSHKQIGDLDENLCYQYNVDSTPGRRNKSSQNVIVKLFNALKMTKDSTEGIKELPTQLLSTRRDVRLSILAGLLDIDGHYAGDDKHAYEITQKDHKLSTAIVRLCRSVGLRAEMVKTHPQDTYYRIHISGASLHDIPCQIRKKMAVNKFGVRKRNERHYSVQMTYDGESDYYGFQLAMLRKGEDINIVIDQLKLSLENALFSGIAILSNEEGAAHEDGRVAGRFLLADYTVTHNSVLLKSVALAVVMAQAGCFVPATSFQFCPFHSIITRLSGKDNMRGGQGTFAVEMTELRTILSRATPKSLVLGDEICHGTEYPSAVNIVASSIVELLEMKTNFIFATHLHSLSNREDVCLNPRLTFQHFHVESILHGNETEIIYNRKLRPGSGPATYGIEVAAAQGIPHRVIERAHRMRREMLDEPFGIVDTRTSNYNAGVLMNRCCIPECKHKAVHMHHIRFQCEADENGMIDGRFHKNRASNQTGLCKQHHNQVHHGNLEIKGWAVTLTGKRRLIIKATSEEKQQEEEQKGEKQQEEQKVEQKVASSMDEEFKKKKLKQTSIARYWSRTKK